MHIKRIAGIRLRRQKNSLAPGLYTPAYTHFGDLHRFVVKRFGCPCCSNVHTTDLRHVYTSNRYMPEIKAIRASGVYESSDAEFFRRVAAAEREHFVDER